MTSTATEIAWASEPGKPTVVNVLRWKAPNNGKKYMAYCAINTNDPIAEIFRYPEKDSDGNDFYKDAMVFETLGFDPVEAPPGTLIRVSVNTAESRRVRESCIICEFQSIAQKAELPEVSDNEFEQMSIEAAENTEPLTIEAEVVDDVSSTSMEIIEANQNLCRVSARIPKYISTEIEIERAKQGGDKIDIAGFYLKAGWDALHNQ